MKLSQALALPDRGGLAVIGGGGKTSLVVALAQELSNSGQVVVTTTTHMGPGQAEELNAPLLTDGTMDCLLNALEREPIVCVASLEHESGKLCAPAPGLLETALARVPWVLAEADGARCLPVKAPAEYEPVFLPRTDLVVAVAGLSALGWPLRKVCHRLPLVCAVLETQPDTILTPAMLARLLTSERGQYKGVGSVERFRVVLNQADTARDLALARETAQEIIRLLPGCRVTAVCLRPQAVVREVWDGQEKSDGPI